MAYTGKTKGEIYTAFVAQLDAVLAGYPSGNLTQIQAESLQKSLAQKGYEEAGKVIDPDKTYPPLRF
jgi:hypothetical protein